MKTTLRSPLTGWVATAVMVVALSALATNTPQVEAMKKSLKSVPVLEMPAKAGQIVSETKVEERDSVALTVIVAAAQVKSAALVPVVGAVVSVMPDSAAAIASAAVSEQPKQAGAITKAAVAAAPSQAGKIVRAVCERVPKKYEEVAVAAVQAAPASAQEISQAVRQVSTLPAVAANFDVGLAAPPIVGDPFTTVPGTPSDINRTNTVAVPPGGGRDYSPP